MTDANFKNAGYALMTEKDPEQKITSTKQTYAPVAFDSKTFSPSQLKMSIYAKDLLSIYFANNCLNGQQSCHHVFSNQNDSTLPLERLWFRATISL